MRPPLLALLLCVPLGAGPALAQAPSRAFNCVGAEDLEDDVFAVPFGAGSTQVTEAARSILAAAAERIRAEPDRNVCILGHADKEGGQSTKLRLAAGRARSVVEALAGRYRVERDRMRSEARVAGFSRRTGTPETRNARIVLLPPAPPVPETGPRRPSAAPPPPAREAPPREERTPATPPREERPPAPPSPPPAPPAKPDQPPTAPSRDAPAATPGEAPRRPAEPPPASLPPGDRPEQAPATPPAGETPGQGETGKAG